MLKLVLCFIIFIAFQGCVKCDSEIPESPTIVEDLGKSREASRTDEELVKREEERIKLDGLSVEEIKALKEKAEKHHYQADVNRLMKLIINSLYQNKEIFLRELISNASDALDKIRLLSLTDAGALGDFNVMDIKIKADKENNILQITDTGIGMTRKDLLENLGTLAKSGTSEFMKEMAKGERQASDLIGQFGVGFYSTFLVADKVVVVSKHNDDAQYIWESDAENFSIVKDPRGNTLTRGTQISLHLKEEALDFLEENTLKTLIKKYSQFINFNIYLWEKSVQKVEEPVEDNLADKKKTEDQDDDEAKVEEEKEIKTNTVEKTVWDWKLMNGAKPIWTRKPSEVDEEEYKEFYKTISKESDDPLGHIHFTAEGEVTFKSILYIPKSPNVNMFSEYGKKVDHIKLYVRRVFITSDFEDMMPKYLAFVFGIVDSDDLPLNVSRETLQQNKLLKVIKKKLIRKVLDMIKKFSEADFKVFWKEYSTNMKLGVVEDAANRNRLAKIVHFYSSFNETEPVSLSSYVSRMKEKQDAIYFVAGQSINEVKNSPFVERLQKKGYEVLYLIEPIDEYCIQALPEFEGKKFQNVAKEGLKLDEGKKAKAKQEKLEKKFQPLLNWFKDVALPNSIEKATISQRLAKSPCALVASSYGWSGNMERLMTSSAYAKSGDPMHQHYANMKKTMEINPGHPIIKALFNRVEASPDDETAKDMSVLLFGVATMRSGFALTDTKDFAERVEKLMRKGYDISDFAEVEEELEEFEDDTAEADEEGDEGEEEEEGDDSSTEKSSPADSEQPPVADDDSSKDFKDEL